MSQTEEKAESDAFDMDGMKEELNGISGTTITYTNEELDAMKQVQQKLIDDHKFTDINPRFLAYTTIVSKNRVDDATKKYMKYIEAIKPCGLLTVESNEDLWKDPDVEKFLRDYYIPCGLDNDGRSIMWIKGKEIPIAAEKTSIRAGILYTLAIHSDAKSLREGITFVIDTSSRPKKLGNENKMQRVNQSYPLRPQAIYLAGASGVYRLVINALIKTAAIFTKQKILQRIKFVSVTEAMSLVPKASGPAYLGGGGGGIGDVVEWTKSRMESLPVPNL